MPFYIYRCKKCDIEFEDKFYYLDGVLYHSDTDKKIGNNPPEKWKCPSCNKSRYTEQQLFREGSEGPAVIVKGITTVTLRREAEFRQQGYNKQQAHNFYKESIEASKERMSTMGEVYKTVAANPQELAKQGQAKKLSDKEKAQKIEVGKKVQQEVAKIRNKKK